MKIYSNASDAIIDLHRKGFTNDFQLSGNDLLWVQEKLFIRAGEFSILEYCKISDTKNNLNEVVVFGIIAPYHNIKGILLSHYKNNTSVKPPVLVKKINELSMLLNNDQSYHGNITMKSSRSLFFNSKK